MNVESLENRRLFSASTPTAQEQYDVELLNRARANPSLEASRYSTDLNEGLPSGTISAAAKQPLAINADLTDSARAHTQWMLSTQTFSHTGVNGSSPDQRMTAAGYTLAPPFAWAENIAWQSQGDTTAPADSTLDAIHQNFYIDSSEGDRGHRVNMMNPSLKEVGVGSTVGNFDGYNATVETEDYAFSGSQSFLTGVAFSDTVVPDNFYSIGEGLGGIKITAIRASDGATFSTTTWSAGGYTLPLAPGTYTVQATGAALNGTVTRTNVAISNVNVEEDFNPLASTGTVAGTGGDSGTNPTPATGTAKPTAALNRHKYAYTSANGHYFCFTVTFTGSNAVVPSSLAALGVTGPKGFTGQALLDSTQSLNNGNTLVAIYYVRRPKGTWSAQDLGLYTIKFPAHGAEDSAGLFADASNLGALRLVLSA